MKILLAIPFLLTTFLSYSQSTPDISTANEAFKYGDWKSAAEIFQKAIDVDTKNADISYKLGICYLQTYVFDKAVHYLNHAANIGSTEKDVLFMLGKAYHNNYQFDKAIETYNKAIGESKDNDLISRAQHYIEQCGNAKKLTAKPLKGVTIINMGPNINSPEPDFTPFMDEDESELFFSSKRQKGNQGYKTADGLYTTDIFWSKEKRGEWSKAKSIGGSVGSSNDEEIVGLTADGEDMFTSLLSFDIQYEIMHSERKGRAYQKPEPYNPPVNSAVKEYSATLSIDKQTLYFCSERGDGIGGYDIYTSKKLPDGEWGEPILMSNKINTKWDELFPHVSGDGKTFFFASEGHNSIGGFDIFRCSWNEQTKDWNEPQNVGYPINSPANEMHIALSKNEKYGYFSTYRAEDSQGDLDIYEVRFDNIEDRKTAVLGNLYFMAPIDYNDYYDFVYYKKDSIEMKAPKGFKMPNDWTKVKEERVTAPRPNLEYNSYIIYVKDGKDYQFALEKAPIDKPEFVFKEVKVQLMPIKDYKVPPNNRPKETKVQHNEAFIEVFDKSNNKRIGEYTPNPKSGRYVIILEPGEYEIKVEAEGFKPKSVSIAIYGKSSFTQEEVNNIILEPTKPPKTVHYKDIKE